MAGAFRRLWYGDPTDRQVLGGSAELDRKVLRAAATAMRSGRDVILPTYESWQIEVWSLYDELVEFYYGVRWLSSMLSRVRLVAAKTPKDQGDEPEPVDGGRPAELVTNFAGGLSGQSQILRRLVVQLAVPGEGWLIGEPPTEDNPAGDRWSVRSAEEVKRSTRRGGRGQAARRAGSELRARRGRAYAVEVIDEDAPPGATTDKWRLLPDDSLVIRVWNPHDRWYAKADSPAQHARSAMRELQLANRYIQAQFLSRLASAGVFVIPSEATFPVRKEFEGLPDAMIREWIETAATAIQNPGSAAAIIPILMQLPSEVIDKLTHIDFTTAFDAKILDKRDSAVSRVATGLDVPKEVLLGMGDVNHWTSWQIEESGFQTHLAPAMETICAALTDGWYREQLNGEGQGDAGDYMIWYDPSEIIARPDKSERALELYDRGELTGEAARRESGLDEADKPKDDSLLEWALRQVLLKGGPDLMAVAFKELTGTELELPEPEPAPGPAGGPEPGSEATGGTDQDESGAARRQPPDTRTEPPPPPGPDQQAAALQMPHPVSGWPMQRRPDGWYVLNVDHWLRIAPEETAVFDHHYLQLQAVSGQQPALTGGDDR